MSVPKGYKRKGANSGTVERIQTLAQYREQYLKEIGKIPVFTAACTRMGIHRQTVVRHAPALAAKWYNPDFHL